VRAAAGTAVAMEVEATEEVRAVAAREAAREEAEKVAGWAAAAKAEEATVAVTVVVRVAVKGEVATAAAREEVVRVVEARAPTQERMSFGRR